MGDTLDEVLAQEELSQILVEKAGRFAGLDAKAVFAFYPEQGNRLSVGEYRFYKTLPNEEVYRQVKAALVELYGDARQETFHDAADAPADAWTDDGSAWAVWSVQGGENAPTPKLDILLESAAGEQVRLQFIAP